MVRKELDGTVGEFHYARVYMSLGEIIEGDFFNHYIKTGESKQYYYDGNSSILSCLTGNILMLSEGRRGIDNVFSLREGTYPFFFSFNIAISGVLTVTHSQAC